MCAQSLVPQVLPGVLTRAPPSPLLVVAPLPPGLQAQQVAARLTGMPPHLIPRQCLAKVGLLFDSDKYLSALHAWRSLTALPVGVARRLIPHQFSAKLRRALQAMMPSPVALSAHAATHLLCSHAHVLLLMCPCAHLSAQGNYFSLAGGRAPFSRLIYPMPEKGEGRPACVVPVAAVASKRAQAAAAALASSTHQPGAAPSAPAPESAMCC